jgi:hypothetical protein
MPQKFTIDRIRQGNTDLICMRCLWYNFCRLQKIET